MVDQFRAHADDGPIVILNPFGCKNAEAWQRFREEAQEIPLPAFVEVGATIEFGGPVGAELIVRDQWESVTAVRYPNFDAFLAVLEHPVSTSHSVSCFLWSRVTPRAHRIASSSLLQDHSAPPPISPIKRQINRKMGERV